MHKVCQKELSLYGVRGVLYCGPDGALWGFALSMQGKITFLEKHYGAYQIFCVEGITFHQRRFYASQSQGRRSERQSGPAPTQQANA